MAATAWAFYHEAKHKLATGDLNLSAAFWRIALYKSALTSPAETATLTKQSSISAECTGGAYNAGGLTLSGQTWTATAAATQKWDVTDPIITASGSPITSIKYAAIVKSVDTTTSGYPMCWSQLSTSAIDVGTGNTITIAMNASGVFTLA